MKLVIVGGASFILGKIFGPSIPFLSGGRAIDLNTPEDLANFRLVETADQLKLLSKTGEELMTIDKANMSQSM